MKQMGKTLKSLTIAATLASGCAPPMAANPVDQRQLACLQQNIYWEARNQSIQGQTAVAWVTLNRVWDKRWPNTICEVVYQPAQFSWTLDTKTDRTTPRPNETDAWETAQIIANSVIVLHAQAKNDPTKSSVYFHTTDIRPSWANNQQQTVILEDHVFYR